MPAPTLSVVLYREGQGQRCISTLKTPPSHTLTTLAPHLLELAKVEHGGPMHGRPVLHTVPIPHRRFPVKATVIRHILQEYALHLAGDLGPFLDIKYLTLFPKELIELRVTVLP